MKYAGKKVGMMPSNKTDVESPAEDKSENEATESKTSTKKNVIKKTGSTGGKPNALGGGGRFQQMVNQGKSPALAAFIGSKVYGKKKMAGMAQAGKASGK